MFNWLVNYTNENYGFQSGEYDLTYTEHEIFITINSVPLRYEYELHNNRLIISNNQATDGSIMRFTKNENNCIDDPLNDLQWLNDMKTSLKQIYFLCSWKDFISFFLH